VRFRGMTKLAYKEGDRTLHIGIETQGKRAGYGYIIYFSDLKQWDPSFQNEPITPEMTEKIKNRIRSALAFMKIKYIEP